MQIKLLINIIIILLFIYNSWSKECPGDMILSTDSNGAIECICPQGKFQTINLGDGTINNRGMSKIGNCSNNYVIDTPKGLANFSGLDLRLWLDAKDPLGNGYKLKEGDLVRIWKDKSSYGNDVTSTNVNSAPVYSKVYSPGPTGVENYPRETIHFTPSADITSNKMLHIPSGYTISAQPDASFVVFLVMKVPHCFDAVTVSGLPIFSVYISSPHRIEVLLMCPSNYVTIVLKDPDSGHINTGSSTSSSRSSLFILEMGYNGENKTQFIKFNNDPSPTPKATTYTALPSSLGFSSYSNSNTTGMVMDLSEVIIFGNNLTESQKNQVRDYLNKKWMIY